MAEEDFTQIRVPIVQRDHLKKRSKRNFRSIPKEIEYLLDTVEKLEKQHDLSKLATPTEGG